MSTKRLIVFAALSMSVVATLIFLTASILGSQRPQLSPPGAAEFSLNGKKITVNYSRPSMRGRKIMGELVPYDKVWRTGANEATSLSTEADLVMGGVTIPKGNYTLFTVPSPQKWLLIINKQTGQWGTDYDQSQDLARSDMKVETLKEPVEQFTISFAPTEKGGVMKLEWESTRARVEFREKK
jgi:hypothetical protein